MEVIIIKILLTLYIIGIICGVIGNIIVRLETASYIKEKSDMGKINKTDWRVSLAGSIKTIVQILMPIYHYFILLGAMITPREKLLKSIDEQIKNQ